jgi:hypothetical protein
VTRYYTLRLTENETDAVRALCSITVDNGSESDTSPEDRAALERVVAKIDAAPTATALCANCGSNRHRACCVRCGAFVPRHRRDAGMGYCTARCEREQSRDDKGSAAMEPP